MKRMTLAMAVALLAPCVLPLAMAGEGCGNSPKPCGECGRATAVPCAENACCNPCEKPGIVGCWDCTFEEGTDIDSLTPAAQSKALKEASQARIVYEGPDNVGVWLNGQRMSALGKKRSYLIPLPAADASYTYEIKVDTVLNSKKYFRRIKIESLKAGAILVCRVETAEGEEVRLDAQIVPTVQP